MFKVGNLTPATCQSFGSSPAVVYPDLYKFYTVYPTTSTASAVGNKRRPHLWTSLNGGRNLIDETSGNQGFYWANYGGNLYFNSDKYHLEAWGHKSQSSSYGSYSASCGTTGTKTGIKLGYQSWSTSSVIPYSTSNFPATSISLSNTSNGYFGVDSRAMYNSSPWSTKNWTITSFGESSSSYSVTTAHSFKSFIINYEKQNEALVVYTYSNVYILKVVLVDLKNLTQLRDFTSELFPGGSTYITTNAQYCSVDFIPGIGYIVMYQDSSQTSQGFKTRLIYTHNPTTGADYNYSQYSVQSVRTVGSSSNRFYSASGAHSWYCPWSKEFYIVPNASQVLWTKDGINWNSSGTTGKSGSCAKFLTDGNTYMILATNITTYKYSTDKGQTWSADISISPAGFNNVQSNDSLVLPFKCINNIGINKNNVTLGYWLNNTNGNPTASATNFYTNDYIPIDPNTSYVFFGRSSDGLQAYSNRITFYDSNKNWISTVEGNNGTWYNGWPAIVTSPSNAAYARTSCRPLQSGNVTQAMVDSYDWYFAKEDDFQVMTEYGDISCN